MPRSKKDAPKTEKLDLGVIGYSGLKQSGGQIEEEFHPRLKGTYGPKVYREMSDNSSTIGAIRYTTKALVRHVEWWAEPADDSPEAEEWAAFLESCLIDMSLTFEDFVSEVLSFLDYGWAYFELVYKLRKGQTNRTETRSQFDDGRVGWRKIALRSQDSLDRWEFDAEDGGLRGMFQADPVSGRTAYIPIEKAVLFRTETTKGNPEGRSIYRNAVIDYYYLKRISEIEAIGIERDMTGLLTMEVPIELLQANASSEVRALRSSLEKMLSELKRDEREFALVPTEQDKQGMPTGYKLKLLSTGGRRQIDTNEVKNYYKISILQSVVAQFVQLGMANVGSFALSSSQTSLFASALGAYLDVIASTFNRFAVSRLMDANAVPQELRPLLVHGDIESPPLAEIGAYVRELATAGQLPDDEGIQRKLLEFAKLPQPEKLEESPTDPTDVSEKRRAPGGLVRKYTRVA